MAGSRSLSTVSLVLVALAACNKDAPPPVDTKPPVAETKAKTAPPPVAPATAANTKGGAPANTKTAAPANTKTLAQANTKSATPQGAATKSAAAPSRAPAPAASANANPAPASAELAEARHVRTVQVSSYEKEAPALWWVAELKKQGIPAYTTKATVDGKEWTRIRVGAAVSGADAHMLADKIHAVYKWPTWIVMVEDKSELPSDALSATRAYVSQP